jgi:uncharacterized protein (TIGR02145 family)
MKSTSTLWQSPNTAATNESGFSGLPGGKRNGFGAAAFLSIGASGYWWSSSENGMSGVWTRDLSYDNGIMLSPSSSGNKDHGCSVRCVKD